MRGRNFKILLKPKSTNAMNIHTLQSAEQHQQISLLLPWYLNQTLDTAERQQVESHIRGCMACRRELVHLRKLAAAVKQTSDLDTAAMASFNRVQAKFQTTRQQAATFDARQPDARLAKRNDRIPNLGGNVTRRRKPVWDFIHHQGIGLAVAASMLLAIVPFAVRFGQITPTTDDYHTLSDAKPAPSSGVELRVVFSRSISGSDINNLLAKIHGERVDGPNSVGAYTVRLDSAKESPDIATAIDFLRSQQVVMLAEPVISQP